MTPKSYRRGYPVAILIGVEQHHAAIWQVFSQVAKHQGNVSLNGDRKDSKATYTFHESIVNALRPTLKQSIRSIIIASPPKTSYAQDLLNHVKAHHTWLFQGPSKATFNLITGSAGIASQVAALTKTDTFKQLIDQTTSQETENLLSILEKRISQTDNLVYFSLEEAEHLILWRQVEGKPKAEYLLLTDDYLTRVLQKNRLHRLIQIAQNKGVKTKVVDAESPAGKRLTQLGGIVCLAKHE
jgi:stalled ribosome rescue protein Dom34